MFFSKCLSLLGIVFVPFDVLYCCFKLIWRASATWLLLVRFFIDQYQIIDCYNFCSVTKYDRQLEAIVMAEHGRKWSLFCFINLNICSENSVFSTLAQEIILYLSQFEVFVLLYIITCKHSNKKYSSLLPFCNICVMNNLLSANPQMFSQRGHM